MSRGPGRVMRAVVRELELAAAEGQDGVVSEDLPLFIFGDAPTRAQQESVRRAVRTLISAGRVERLSRSRSVTGLDGKVYPPERGTLLSVVVRENTQHNTYEVAP